MMSDLLYSKALADIPRYSSVFCSILKEENLKFNVEIEIFRDFW